MPLAPILLILPVLKGAAGMQDSVVVDELHVSRPQVIVHPQVFPGSRLLQQGHGLHLH